MVWLSIRLLPEYAIDFTLLRVKGDCILCYHSIGENLPDYPYVTAQRAFEEQLRILRSIGNVLPLSSILRRPGAPSYYRGLNFSLTFDDGYCELIDLVTPIIKNNQVTAAVFIAKDLICSNNESFLAIDEVRALVDSGVWEVGSHGVSHNTLYSLRDVDLEQEIVQSKRFVESITASECITFAYPKGRISKRVVALTRRHMKYGLTTGARVCNRFDTLQIPRLCIERHHDNLSKFKKTILYFLLVKRKNSGVIGETKKKTNGFDFN